MEREGWLIEGFETNRARLTAVAYRILGSRAEAEDAIQESWIRLTRSDTSDVENLAGWLTTVTSRVCLDMLRARTVRREEPIPDLPLHPLVGSIDPEQEALLGDSVGLALLVVLDTLAPPERVAFVLHDVFGLPFGEIAAVVGRSPEATRQLASRARRRVQGASTADLDRTRQREIVSAFLAASRGGDFDALVALLDPDVVLGADAAAVTVGASERVRGAGAVAQTFAGRARGARLALVDGKPGLVWSQGGAPRIVFEFAIRGDAISAITLLADPNTIAALELGYVDD